MNEINTLTKVLEVEGALSCLPAFFHMGIRQEDAILVPEKSLHWTAIQ
jgi:hypothetical protein